MVDYMVAPGPTAKGKIKIHAVRIGALGWVSKNLRSQALTDELQGVLAAEGAESSEAEPVLSQTKHAATPVCVSSRGTSLNHAKS